jgi:transcriptional regulator with XRE-family HTH domain
VLDAEFGKSGTPERTRAIEDAYAFYSGQILYSARKAAGITQSELAEKINSSKSYISKLEKGHINPSAGLFFTIINALGMRVEIVKPI